MKTSIRYLIPGTHLSTVDGGNNKHLPTSCFLQTENVYLLLLFNFHV